MERMRKFKLRIISATFTFLLTLLLIILFLCLDLYFGVFHDKSILRKVNESNYYNEIYKELNAETEKLVTEAGLPIAVLKDVITLERVYINGKHYVENTLQGRLTEISTEKLRESLLQNMNQYLAEQNILQNQELTAATDNLISEIEQVYRQRIQLNYIRYLTDYRARFLSVMRWLLPVTLLCIAAICYFLINMHTYKHRGIRQIDYALNASSLLTIGTAIYLLMTGNYGQSGVIPEYYRRFILLSIRWDVQVLLYLGCLGAAVSLVLVTIIGFYKNRIGT